MDIISRFIATFAILLHVLVIFRGQNDLVTAQGKLGNSLNQHKIYPPLPTPSLIKEQH